MHNFQHSLSTMRSEVPNNHRWYFQLTRWDSTARKCQATWAPANAYFQSNGKSHDFLWTACKRFGMHLMWRSEKMQLQREMQRERKKYFIRFYFVWTFHKREQPCNTSWSSAMSEMQPQMESGVIERKDKHEIPKVEQKKTNKKCEINSFSGGRRGKKSWKIYVEIFSVYQKFLWKWKRFQLEICKCWINISKEQTTNLPGAQKMMFFDMKFHNKIQLDFLQFSTQVRGSEMQQTWIYQETHSDWNQFIMKLNFSCLFNVTCSNKE